MAEVAPVADATEAVLDVDSPSEGDEPASKGGSAGKAASGGGGGGGGRGSAGSLKVIDEREVRRAADGSGGWRASAGRAKLNAIYDHVATQVFLYICLAIALFLGDIWVLSRVPSTSDNILDGILFAVFLVFVLEILVQIVVKDGYLGGFFFLMDIAGTVSMIFDISFMLGDIIDPPPSATPVADGEASQGPPPLAALRAARAAKLGAKAGRLTRIARLFKMLSAFGHNNDTDGEQQRAPAKRIAGKLGSVLSKRVAALTMILVMVYPLLTVVNIDLGPQSWAQALSYASSSASATETVQAINAQYSMTGQGGYFRPVQVIWQRTATASVFNTGAPHVTLTRREWSIENVTDSPLPSPSCCHDPDEVDPSGSTPWDRSLTPGTWSKRSERVRENKCEQVSATPFTTVETKVWPAGAGSGGATQTVTTTVTGFGVICVQNSAEAIEEAMWGLISMFFVIGALLVFSMTFSSSIEDLMVKPLERMLGAIRESAKEVLDSMAAFDDESGEGKDGGDDTVDGDGSGHKALLETELLEMVVMKMARLVEIMAPGVRNLAKNDDLDDHTKLWLVHEYAEAGEAEVLAENRMRATISEESALTHIRRGSNFRPQNFPGTPSNGGTGEFATNPVDSWGFKVLDTSDEFMFRSLYYMFEAEGVTETFGLEKETMVHFFAALSARYLPNEYHNFYHACDVTHTVYRFMRITGAEQWLKPLDRMALLTAAVAHDVGHLGVNNAYLVKTTHDLALRHNDTSPLENMHAAVLYEVLKADKTNLFKPLQAASRQDWVDLRKTIIGAILATDMAHHFEMVKEVGYFAEINEAKIKWHAEPPSKGNGLEFYADPEHRTFFINLFMHSADISNPIKPYESCEAWALLIIEEFFAQGIKEKELGHEPMAM